MSAAARRERPFLNVDTEAFWSAAQHGRLVVQRCNECDVRRFPFFANCSECGSDRWSLVDCAGGGRIYSFVVVHYPPVPGWPAPYVTALVELDEGPRMITRLHVDDPAVVEIGQRVLVHFTDDGGFTYPDFVLDQAS